MDDRTVHRLQLSYQRHRGIANFLLIVGIVFSLLAVVLIHTKYSATADVLMVAEPPGQNPDVPSTATKPIMASDLPILATSTPVLQHLQKRLHDSESLEKLRLHIRAKINYQSSVMPVQFTAKSQQMAIEGANLVADEVTDFYRQIATSRFDSLIGDLQQRLREERNVLRFLDNRLDVVARSYPYVDTGGNSGITSDSNASVYQRLIALSSQRDDIQATLRADQAATSGSTALVTDARPLAQRDLRESDPVYRELRDQYAHDVEQLQHLQATTNSAYPGLAELQATVVRERNALAEERRQVENTNLSANSSYALALDSQVKNQAQLASDKAKLDAVNHQISMIQQQIGNTQVAADVANIRRDRDNAQAAYALLGQRLAEAMANRVQAAATGSVMVMDRAVIATPQVYTSGPFIGFAIFLLTVWLVITLLLFIAEKPSDATERTMIAQTQDNYLATLTHEGIPPSKDNTPTLPQPFRP